MGRRHRGRDARHEALIDALGENNPILRDLLQTAKQEIYLAGTENARLGTPRPTRAYAAATTSPPAAAATGRRLMQRKEYNVRMTDALITAEIMEFYGKGGIPGVTGLRARRSARHGAAGLLHPTAICKAFRLQARGALLVR